MTNEDKLKAAEALLALEGIQIVYCYTQTDSIRFGPCTEFTSSILVYPDQKLAVIPCLKHLHLHFYTAYERILNYLTGEEHVRQK